MTQHFITISVIGIPNVGKSSLVNTLVGEKISIVTHKAQTTRRRITALHIKNSTQMVFTDTPGLVYSKETFARRLQNQVWDSIYTTDAIVWVINAAKNLKSQCSDHFIEYIKKSTDKLIIVLNKIDLVQKDSLLLYTNKLCEMGFSKCPFLMVSAKTKSGLKDLENILEKWAPEKEWLFSPDQLSLEPLKLLAAEFTREKIYESIHEEIPYTIAVITELWEEFKNKSVKIHQVIYVKKKSHKGILIGAKGGQLKNIGIQARQEIERLIGQKVHLYLQIKVHETWDATPHILEEMGLINNQ